MSEEETRELFDKWWASDGWRVCDSQASLYADFRAGCWLSWKRAVQARGASMANEEAAV